MNKFHLKMLYRTDWNGKGAVPVISGLYEEFSIQTDGRYLYIDDSAYKMLEDPESDIHVQVYDENMEPVDEYIIPETKSYPMGGPVGGEKYQYLLFDDGETGEWGLYIWDKSEIGTLHGKPYTQQKVVYESRE